MGKCQPVNLYILFCPCCICIRPFRVQI